jgi:hypothetical protein
VYWTEKTVAHANKDFLVELWIGEKPVGPDENKVPCLCSLCSY